jgi:hypothetical protein
MTADLAAMEKTEPRRLGLGWHWLWFFPLCVLVLLLVERHTVVYGFVALKLAWQRWSWGVLISPSAAFCLSVIGTSIIAPLSGLGIVALLVAARQQWRWVLLMVGGILLLPIVTDFLIWGSFPLVFDNAGMGRLRMIPFIPWPYGEYGEVCWMNISTRSPKRLTKRPKSGRRPYEPATISHGPQASALLH